MSRSKKTALLVVGLLVGLLTAGARTVGAETLTATFTQPDGGVTVNAYYGLVQIHVTGVGQAYGAEYNDAFYLLPPRFDPPQNGWDGSYYQLGFGTGPLAAFDQHNAKNVLVGPLPAYNPAHEYTFVLNTGLSTPGQLHFGVTDGGFSDNAGAFTITVTQLDGNGNPAPASPAPPSATPSSAPVHNTANGHWYQGFRTGGLTWQQAKDAAAALSYAGLPGHLVTITSSEENQFILTQVPAATQGENWIGLYQDRSAPDYREPDGGWRWITGEPYSWNDWRGEPNNANGNEDVAVMRSTVGWNDLSYTDLQYGYIVEFEPPTSPGAASVAHLLVNPNPVVGGQTTTGEVVLSQLAGPGGVVVPLVSGNPAAAVVPATVTVSEGTTGITFPVTTFAVAAATPVILTAGGPGSPITATLQVVPNLSPAGNLLVNGSFEEPKGSPYGTRNLPGWQVLSGTVDLVSAWQPAPGQGDQSLDLVGSPGAATIEQSFPTEPGRDYLFSGWVAHNSGIPEGRAVVFLNSTFFVQLQHNIPSTDADMHWVAFNYRFRATTSVTTLSIQDITGLSDLRGTALDGLVVTPAGGPLPPPSAAPAAPTNLVAQATSPQQIDLTWKDNSNNETRFEIQRRGIGSDWENVGTAPANATTFQDPTVGSDIHYIYRVRAVNETSVSAWSDEVSVDTGLIASISLNPSSLNFGDQFVGTTNGAQSILLQNTGQTPVEIRHVSIEGANPGDFAITADGATGLQLLPNRICIVNVGFRPTVAGPRSASLTITDSAAGSPHVVPLSGTGLAAAVQRSPSSLAFGEQPVSSASGAQTVTITNTGTAPLTIPAVTLAGDNPGEFAISTAASGVTVAPGESRTLEVRFAPTRPGSRSAILVISDNAPGSPHLVMLSGTGTAPSVTFGISRLERPTKVSFGDQPVGATGAAQTLTVTNSGAAPLTISSVRITGANAADFALSADSGGPVLAPGRTRQFTLRFKPGAKGSRTASLTLSDNAAGSPHSVALQGVGVMVPPTAPSGLTLQVTSFKEIQLAWSPSSADATAYAIWRKVGSGEFQRYSGVAGNVTRFVDRHVSPKTTYTYRVRANGPGGISGWSNEAGGTTPAAPPPAAPTSLTVQALTASQLELRWTDNSSDETSFAIWRKSGSGAWTRVGGVPSGVNRFVDRNLAASTSYSYEMRANGPGGVSAWSNQASGKTLSGTKSGPAAGA